MTPDAGEDAATPDGGRLEDAGPDASLLCAAACTSIETCCTDPSGASSCVNLRDDVHHCGVCEVDCVASHRGDSCSARQCSCGTADLGCTGNRQSWCCPPRLPGTPAYCANLDRSPADCGACNAGCDARQADRCDGGHCVCGDSRSACAGTPESVCCLDVAKSTCVDTTTNVRHCGACNNICAPAERCEGGTCTLGEACPAGCGPLEVCCDGACCARDRCIEGVCGGPPDAG